MQRIKKSEIFFTYLVILSPYLFLFFLKEFIPFDRFPSSFAAPFLIIPIFLLLLQWIVLFFVRKDPKNVNQSKHVFKMVIWILPITSLFVFSLFISVLLGKTIDFRFYLSLPFGILFIILGNLLPECKQNSTIGVRVKWALESNENWKATHQFTGKLWVLGGIIILLSSFVNETILMGLFLLSIVILSFLPIVFSYFFYRKQLKSGIISKKSSSKHAKTSTLIVVLFVSVILVFTGTLLFSGDIHVSFHESEISIDPSFWPDETVAYSSIHSLEFRETDDIGSRISGLGSHKLFAGLFENTEFNLYTRYSYTKCNSCIVITLNNGNILVLNGKDNETTRILYENLMTKILP